MTVEVLLLSLAAVAVGYALTYMAIRVLPRLRLLSKPDPNHPTPVPVGGGLVIWTVAGGAVLALWVLGHEVSSIVVLFLGATILFLAGLWDDARVLEPRTKLLIQVGAASAMIVAGVTFPLGNGLEWIAVPITILWFVGVCNAVNLIDNMDGMLPGVAAVAAVFMGVFAAATGRPETAALSWIVAGACAGFLPFNLPPARIFMGDSGSMFLGFLLAGLAIGEDWRGLTNLGFTILTPALLLAVPIFNTSFVTVTRKLSGVPLSQGKADHINYRLLAHGLSRGRALGAVYALSAVAGGLAVLVVTVTPLAYVAWASLFLIVMMYLGVFLYEGRVQQYQRDFRVEKEKPGWEQSAWYRWVIRVAAVAGDVVLVFAALYVAFLLRFDGAIPDDQLRNLAAVLPYLIAFRVGIALLLGVYETKWRLGLARDAIRLVGTVVLGTVLFAALLFLLRPPSFPRTVIVLEGLLSLIFFGMTRLGVRALGEVTSMDRDGRSGLRTIIAGPSDALTPVRNALRSGAYGAYHVVGFADDDPIAQGSLVGGVRVLGPVSRLRALASRHDVERVILAFPDLPEDELERLVRSLLDSGVSVELARMEMVPARQWLADKESRSLKLEALSPPAFTG